MIGIYCITNTINNKKYIGQSRNIEKRIKKHFSKHNENKHFKASISKYGNDSFKVQVLREIHESGIAQTLLNCYEDFYINKFNTLDSNYGYNKMEGGSPGRLCQESIEKRIIANKGQKRSVEQKRNISNGLIGHNVTVESRMKISISRKGKNTGKRNPEIGKKISLRKKGCIGRKKTQEEKDKISVSMKLYRAKSKEIV